MSKIITPRQYEEFVCEYYQQQGYKTKLTSYSNDYSVDVFAEKGQEKLAIQAKMYGNTTRKVNRDSVMLIYAAKDYFKCSKHTILICSKPPNYTNI